MVSNGEYAMSLVFIRLYCIDCPFYLLSSYISEDNRIPYGSSQWKPSEPLNQVPVTVAATSIYTPEVTKSLPTSHSSATQLQAGKI